MGRPSKGHSVHSEELLKCAQMLLEDGHLVDTTVMTQGKTFKAHGLVLAAYSCYFKAVMTSDEGSSNFFVLDNLQLTSAAFKVILDYMYNGVLNVVEEDLKHVEHAATQLQVESAVKLIVKMKSNLERIHRRQQQLEAKIERKRLRRLQRETAWQTKDNKSDKQKLKVVETSIPEDEDTEDVQIAQPIPEEEQLDVIAQAWKAIAGSTYQEYGAEGTSETADAGNSSSPGDKMKTEKCEDGDEPKRSENSRVKSDADFNGESDEDLKCLRGKENQKSENVNSEETEDAIENTENIACEEGGPEVNGETGLVEENQKKSETESKMEKKETVEKSKENTRHTETPPVPGTSQESNITVRRELKLDFGSLRLTLGSNIDLNRLLDSDDSLSSSSETENENENFRDDPDFNVSQEEDFADDPDYVVEKKAVKKEYRRVLRKPSRPVRVRKMRKRKGRPRKVVVRDDEEDDLENDLEENAEDSKDGVIKKEDKVSVKTEVELEPPIKRRRGRPKGSKNKGTTEQPTEKPKEIETETQTEMRTPIPVVVMMPKRRGRPPGSGKKEAREQKAKKSTSDKPKRPKTKLLPEENLWTMYDKEVNMFQCPECPYRTRTDKVFRLHRRRHTGYKPYPCQYCGKGFIDRKYLVPHERSHTGERPYKCEYCPSAFFDKKHLNRHVKRHTGQRDCLCSECGLAFYDNDTLKRHHTAVHLNIRPFKCDSEGCKYAAKDASALKEHKQQHSRDAEGILCDLCGKTFINMNGLRIHKISHEEAKFQCDHCPFSAHYKHVLRNHCVRLHGVDLQGKAAIKNIKCELCDFMCFTKQERHLHMLKKHLNERPHKCPICDFSTVDKGSLKKHLRSHTGVAPFECVCGKRFAQHSGYIRHYRSHTGEKPYSCKICGKMYADKKSLNTHLYGHANAKPYVCQICGMFSGVRQEHLRKHIIKQHGEEVFEEYKRKGLCRPTLGAQEAAALSANANCEDVGHTSHRSDEPSQNATLEEVHPSPAPSHEGQHVEANQVLMVASTAQQTSGQPQQQILMAPQIRVYEDSNMTVSHPMVVFPQTSQALLGGFSSHAVMEQHLPPQAHMGHLTTVNMSELTALTPLTHPQQQQHQLSPTNLVLQHPSSHLPQHPQQDHQTMQHIPHQPHLPQQQQHQVPNSHVQYYSPL